MRKYFKKSLEAIPVEEAHGGSGKRQLILSKADPISMQVEAMTKGFLSKGGAFDWHEHKGIDELFLVLKGTGRIQFRDGSETTYAKDDLVYIPAGTPHRIENTGSEENEFLFVRVRA